MRRGRGHLVYPTMWFPTLGPIFKPSFNKKWYCACVVPKARSRGTVMRYHNTLFNVAPIMLSS